MSAQHMITTNVSFGRGRVEGSVLRIGFVGWGI